MNLWTKFCALLFVAFPSVSLWALPPGLARIHSVFTDRADGKPVLISGYGIVIEMSFKLPDGTEHSQFVIQTPSHLSQGGYDTGHASATSPDGSPKPVPKLLVELYLDGEQKVFAHHSWTPLEKEFEPVVGGAVVQPLIASSYFESFRDLDLLILEQVPKNTPVVMKLSYTLNEAGETLGTPGLKMWELNLADEWRWFRLSNTLAIPCPKSFASCTTDRFIQADGPIHSPLSRRILNDGFVPGEYEFWVNFSAESGMSGLPVFKTDSNGTITGIVGLISGTDVHTGDTWLSQILPKVLFDRWIDAVRGFLQSNEIFKVYGFKDFIWMLSDGQLSRVGETMSGVRFQESKVDDKFKSPRRCNRGSGFRMDNGSGFRFDTGESDCPTDLERGRTFLTQKPNERPHPTAFMVMDHSDLTLFFPPTATGMGYYFLQSDLDVIQQDLKIPADRAMQFKIVAQSESGDPTSSINAAEFGRFAKTIYQPVGDTWQASLLATVVDRSSATLTEKKAHVTLKPQFDSAQRLLSVSIHLQIEGGGSIQHKVDYANWSAKNSIANMYQNVKLKDCESLLNLEGLLMHNPDLMNIPDLDMTFRNDVAVTADALEFVRNWGDPDLRTIFTLKSGSKVYYFSVVR